MAFTHKMVVDIHIVDEINLCPFHVGRDFPLGNSLIGAVKLTKNANFDKHKYSEYGIGFDACGTSSLSNGYLVRT